MSHRAMLTTLTPRHFHCAASLLKMTACGACSRISAAILYRGRSTSASSTALGTTAAAADMHPGLNRQ